MSVRWISIILFCFAALAFFFSTALEPRGSSSSFGPEDIWEYAPRIVLSIVLLIASLFVILNKKYPAADKHWLMAPSER